MIAIAKKIISLQLPKLVKNSSVRRRTVEYKNAERVGVITTLDEYDKQQAIDEFVDRLVGDQKEVEVLCYDKRQNQNKIFGYIQFSNRDISMFGSIGPKKSWISFIETSTTSSIWTCSRTK